MEFQLIHSNKCAIHECSQLINMMSMLRITHKYCIMLILMTYLQNTLPGLQDTNDIENINQAQYNENRQDILNAWQKDTPVKTLDNRQVLDNIEAYAQDRLNITQSFNHRLGLTEISLLGAQPVTVAAVQSDQLTTNIPNHLPNSIATGQQDDYD